LDTAIIITAIIVAGVVAIAALVLNAGYRAWKDQHDRETAVAAASAGRTTYHIHCDATPQEAGKAVRDYLLVNPN
jgi:hypothetical protein